MFPCVFDDYFDVSLCLYHFYGTIRAAKVKKLSGNFFIRT